MRCIRAGKIRLFPLTLAVSTVFLSDIHHARAQDQALAFGAPGSDFSWASAAKESVGTAFEAYQDTAKSSGFGLTGTMSKAWYTAASGILTETYYPAIDMAQTRDTQILVTDESGFFEEERTVGNHIVEPSADSPLYTVTSTGSKGRYVIRKRIFADPDRNAVVTRYEIESRVPGLRFHLLHKPAARNTGSSDMGRVESQGETSQFHGWEDDYHQVVRSSIGFGKSSVGYVGASDGWQDLKMDGAFDWRFSQAGPGNIAFLGELPLADGPGTHHFTVAIGFGRSKPEAIAQASGALSDPDYQEKLFASQWKSYLDRLKPLENPQGTDTILQYRVSLWLAKSHEDKTYPGAFVASLSIPWGEKEFEPPLAAPTRGKTGYHAVWPRDLTQTALALMHAGDVASARSVARYLKKMQLGENSGEYRFGWRRWPKSGSWSQNMWVDGTPHWVGLQLDQVGFPIILVYQLWDRAQVDPDEFRMMVERAADFIASYGPESPMERWEETHGYSPSNIAAAATALVAAADLMDRWGDAGRAERYRGVADLMVKPGQGLDNWLYTTTGVHGNGQYYVRVEGASDTAHNDIKPDPNDDRRFWVANGGGYRLEKEVVDAGFLELVRYGLRPGNSARIENSIKVVDKVLRVDIPGKGPGFFRYNFDGYGADTFPTKGQLWPIFTGERAIAEMSGMLEANGGQPPVGTERASLLGLQRAMELFANQGKMIPEQIWSEGPAIGTGTGAATPLVWSHAEFITLARSLDEGRPVTWVRAARERYGSE